MSHEKLPNREEVREKQFCGSASLREVVHATIDHYIKQEIRLRA